MCRKQERPEIPSECREVWHGLRVPKAPWVPTHELPENLLPAYATRLFSVRAMPPITIHAPGSWPMSAAGKPVALPLRWPPRACQPGACQPGACHPAACQRGVVSFIDALDCNGVLVVITRKTVTINVNFNLWCVAAQIYFPHQRFFT